jgi:hypothetical protein
MELRSDSVVGYLDELSELGCDAIVTNTAARGGFVIVRGWLYDREAERSADTIRIRLNSGPAVEAVVGLNRPDVANVMGTRAAASGFAAAIPVLVTAGSCTLAISPAFDDRSRTIELHDVIEVVDAPDPFAGLHPDPGHWMFSVDGVFDGAGRCIEVDAAGAYVLPADAGADARLWVLDAGDRQPPQALVVRFGGRHLIVSSTIERLDAALSIDAPGARMCGFSIPLMPSPIGTEIIDVYAVGRSGAYAHLTSLRVRRPEPLSAGLLPPTAPLIGALDAVFCDGVSAPAAGDIPVDVGMAIRLCGWVVDPVGPRLTGGIEVLVDGRVAAETHTRLVRTDVAASLGTNGVAECGFDVLLTVPQLAAGPHVLAVRALSSRRDATGILAQRRLNVPPAKPRQK